MTLNYIIFKKMKTLPQIHLLSLESLNHYLGDNLHEFENDDEINDELKHQYEKDFKMVSLCDLKISTLTFWGF